jgi:hypothetical protein
MMSIDLLWFVVAVASALVIGWLALTSMFPGKRPFALFDELFLAFAFGFGIVTWTQLIASFAKIELRPPTTSAILVIALAALAWPSRGAAMFRRPSFTSFRSRSPANRAPVILLAAIATISLVATLLRSYWVEIDLWDSWWMWAYKAKIVFHHGRLPIELLEDLRTGTGHWDYPMHVPFMEAWIMGWLGYWNDQFPRLIVWLFYAGTCINVYAFCRRKTSQVYSWMAVCFFATLSALQHWTIGSITEPILLFYYLASLFLLLRWFEERDDRLLVFSGIMAGLAASTKNEGLALFASNLVCLGAFLLLEGRGSLRAFARPVAFHLLAAAIVILPWNLYKAFVGLSNDVIRLEMLSRDFLSPRLGRVAELPEIFWHHLSSPDRWNILWAVFFLSLVLHWRQTLRGSLRYLLIPLIAQFLVYATIYVLWPYLGYGFVGDTLSRLLVVPASIAIVYMVLANAPRGDSDPMELVAVDGGPAKD